MTPFLFIVSAVALVVGILALEALVTLRANQ